MKFHTGQSWSTRSWSTDSFASSGELPWKRPRLRVGSIRVCVGSSMGAPAVPRWTIIITTKYACACVASSEAGSPKFHLNHHLLQYIVQASTESSVQTVNMLSYFLLRATSRLYLFLYMQIFSSEVFIIPEGICTNTQRNPAPSCVNIMYGFRNFSVCMWGVGGVVVIKTF